MMANADRGPAPGRLYTLLWRWHFWAALIVIPFVLWQSTTGSLYLWSEWWMDVGHPDLRFVAPSAHHVSLRDQIAAALASVRPSGRTEQSPPTHVHGTETKNAPAPTTGPAVQDILVSDNPLRSTIVLLLDPDGLPYPVFVDPRDGRVLGTLTPLQWLPGITRALHGGWPLGKPGSWLLELGDCWAIVMILTGFYMWWPRRRSLREALWPRFHAGPRLLMRDLHSCVAVLFSAVFLFFLISALPWTAFWGGELLARVQTILGQDNPAGFSIGGASSSQITVAAPSIDAAVAAARARGVTGTLSVRLSPWPNAPLFITNQSYALSDDRILLGDAANGAIKRDFRHDDLPLIPRFVAVGIHVHQGDFGLANLWLNTLFALSLIWLSVTGVVSWWIRKPRHAFGAPPRTRVQWPRALVAIAATMCVLLPIFAASVLAVAGIDWLVRGFPPAKSL